MKRTTRILSFALFGIAVAILIEKLVFVRSIQTGAILAIALLVLLGVMLWITSLLADTRHRIAALRFWLAASVSGVTYLAVDLLAGTLLLHAVSPLMSPDPLCHHRPEPGALYEFHSPEYHYRHLVNDLGMRGSDVAHEKPAGVSRILMLGDSFTMGKGVSDDRTFSAVLERSLNAKNQTPVEVLNAGTDSYSPVLSFFRLQDGLLDLAPDVVIMNLDMSDLEQEQIYLDLAVRNDKGEIVGVSGMQSVSFSGNARRWINRNLFMTSSLLMLAEQRVPMNFNVHTGVERANKTLLAHTLATDTESRDDQWEDIFRSIRWSRDLCATKGVPFVLTVYPWGHQVSDTEWATGRKYFVPTGAKTSDRSLERVRAFCADEHIPLFDAFPLFRAYKAKDPLYFDVDMHWTEAGHALMARGLETFLNEISLHH